MNSLRDTSADFALTTLEFPAIMALLERELSSPLARPALQALRPGFDLEKIEREIALAREASEYLGTNARPGLGGLADPRPVLEKLRVESCTGSEILMLAGVARAACECRGMFIKTPFRCLDGLAARIPDFRDILREIDGKILPDGSVDSSASPALARIRRSIEQTRAELQSRLERIMHRLGQDQALQDDLITLRNGRFVLPVKSDKKRQVEGVVHGASSSGQSVFIEPLETLPLNNDLVELEDRENLEVQRVLDEFSAKLRMRLMDFAGAAETLSALDLAFAKAEFARRYGACFPVFSRERDLDLREAVHPLLVETLRPLGRKPVPLTLTLTPPQTIVVISGPNTGGKTVAMKTVGAAVLMAQAGLPVTAASARLPLFHRVAADIGDQQSIAQSLSTFSAHIRNLQSILSDADEHSLALLDEIGGSTDPAEGAALAVAVLERLRKSGAVVFASTHHSRLKAYSIGNPQAVNAAMDFDEATLQPTYRFRTGLPGKSSGLEIASRLGLDPEIVEQARALLDPSEAEAGSLIANLHHQRTRLEERESQLAARARELEQQVERDRRAADAARGAQLKELDKRLEKTLREYAEKWAAAIEEIRRSVAKAPKPSRAVAVASRRSERLAQDARAGWNIEALEALHPAADDMREPAAPVTTGSQVRVRHVPAPGTVTALFDNGEVEVELGRIRMRVPRESVRVLPNSIEGKTNVSAQRAAPMPSQSSHPAASSSEHHGTPPGQALTFDAELNVIGANAEDAREQVDKFLDNAFLAGHRTLRIIHGYGKGVLRKTLHEMFATHIHVERFYPAPRAQGGDGVTVVEVKR